MRINITLEDDNQLNGYANINPNALNEAVDDAEAEEIRAINILPYYPQTESAKIINSWLRKLKHGGKIIIGAVDILEVSRDFSTYFLDIDTANLFLYGEEGKPSAQAGFTVMQVSEYLESKGLKITKRRTEDYRFVVEAIRP